MTTAAILLAALVMFYYRWESIAVEITGLMRRRIGILPTGDLSTGDLFRIFLDDASVVMRVSLPFMLALLVVGIAVNYTMIGPLFTTQALRPDIKRINPITGFKRFFAWRSVVEAVKGIVKLSIVGFIVWQLLSDRYDDILLGFRMSPERVGPIIADTAFQLAIRCILALIAIAIIDVYWQRFDYKRSLKMSKQEVKDESKQQEGDPLVKAEIRKRMRMAARRRMMQQVPQATVVITNPTHYAVALKYDKTEGIEVPMVVAKGVDDVAMRIRAVAEEHGVPLIENPPLARELFRAVDLGDAIPQELYATVAEILVTLHKSQPQKVAL